MIYDKPRDISLRVFPSLSSFAPSKRKKNANEETKPKQKKPEKTINENRRKVVKKSTSDFPEEPIIDITLMPVVDGIPMLELSDSEEKPAKAQPIKKEPDIPLVIKPIIDISEMPDIEGIPLLELPEEINPAIFNDTQITPLIPEEADEKIIRTPEPPPFTEINTVAKAPVPVKKKKEQKQKVKTETVVREKKPLSKTGKAHLMKVASFFLMLYIGMTVAFIISLRPTYSETEKRNLKEFPEFSINALLSGDFFEDIGTWFSDTFPYREALTKANTKIKSLYGFDSVAIHGEIEAGDEIPDAPLKQDATEAETTSPETETTRAETTAPVTMPDQEDLQSGNGDPDAKKPDVETQSLGAIIVADNAGYEYYSFSEDLAPRFINAVNNIKSSASCRDVYAMLIPTSIDITLNDALRADIKSANQKKALDYFNASFKNTEAVDGIYDAERLHRDEYIYFRTDHHWTALGAYYAYEQFAEEKGIKPTPLKKYKTQTFEGFLGTFYATSGQNSNLGETPDSVTAYLPFNNVTCQIDEGNGNVFQWDVIKDVSDYSQSLKYITFIGGDNALTTITNADNPAGETCVVIKESYGNAFVPFLIPHYSTIYVIDPRHYNGTLSNFTSDKEIDDVIFIANISTTRNYIYIEAMEKFIK